MQASLARFFLGSEPVYDIQSPAISVMIEAGERNADDIEVSGLRLSVP